MSLRVAFAVALLAAAPAPAQRLAYQPVPETDESGPRLHYALLDRLEWAPEGDGYAWDFSAMIGGDTDRVWLSSVGEGGFGGALDYLELQALYSRAVGGGWDLNAGLRWDARPDPQRFYLTVGGQLDKEPLWLGAFAYLSHEGELSARITTLYNLKLAGPLILQPSAELNAYAQDVPELGIGRGLAYGEAGLRLRYQAADAFAPYVGLSWERLFGRTARLARAADEEVDTKSVVLGVRSDF